MYTGVVHSGVFVVISFLVWKLVVFIRMYSRMCQKLRLLPQRADTHWLKGNMDKMCNQTKYVETIQEMVETDAARLYCLWVGPIPLVVVTHPSTCKQLMGYNIRKPLGFLGGYRFLKDGFGDGLILSDGQKWSRNRKLLSPAFHADILEGYIKVMKSTSTNLLSTLVRHVGYAEGFDPSPFIYKATLDTILKCCLSYEGSCLSDRYKSYLHACGRIQEIILIRYMTPWLYPNFIFRLSAIGREFNKMSCISRQFIAAIVDRRRGLLNKENQNNNVDSKQRLDFLDILLNARDETGAGLTLKEVYDEVETITVAGHETTASAIMCAIHSLVKYPDIQDNVYSEVKRVMGTHTEVSVEDLGQLRYLDRFVNEVLRYYTPVAAVGRTSSPTESIYIDGFEIPPGPQVDIMIAGIHHNEEVWTDHKEFNVDRFENEQTESRNMYSFIPFLTGPRKCIGQHFALNEIKITIATLLQRFEVEEDTLSSPEFHYFITLKTTGLRIRLKER